jgi:Phage tail tube protein
MGEKANRVINGTYGSIWVEGEKYADVDSFEAKVTINYEELNMAEEGATKRKATGWNGEGNLTVKKIYSRGVNLVSQSLKEGKTAYFTIVGKLADPDSYGAERVTIKEVTFSEFMLMKFEQKTLGTEELPFAFGDYDLVDTIPSN